MAKYSFPLDTDSSGPDRTDAHPSPSTYHCDIRLSHSLPVAVRHGMIGDKPLDRRNAMYRLLPALFGISLLAALPTAAQDAAKARLEKSPRHQEWVKVKHDAREMQCFIVYPQVR